MALHDHVDRIRTERLLDAAQAAAFPHLDARARRSWLTDAQRRVRRQAIAQAATNAAASGAVFTVDGRPVDKQGLARWLAITFGSPGYFGQRRSAPAAAANGHAAQGPGRS